MNPDRPKPTTSDFALHPHGALEVVAVGPRAIIEDLGRPGLARLGVGRSGAADRRSHCLAQRIVGNREEAAGIEVTLGGLALRAHGSMLVTVVGAPLSLTVDGRDRSVGELIRLRDGDELRLGMSTSGLRSYVAVRGGFDVEPVLGSRSTDILSGLGPKPLEVGDLLSIGELTMALPTIDAVALRALTYTDSGQVELRIAPGPRLDWIESRDALTEPVWKVSSRSDRIGVRLEGANVGRNAAHESAELPSEGVVRGSIQVPAGGEPVLFLADHPVTGGYPVAAVVVDADIDRAAQLRPGDEVRLIWRKEGR
ncbi:5-oxoprolinase subunit C family protein [Mobilicoccus massiliensis]|uniref:5-oxoprolinase subunit C family protein n=1 Tax=Mobilicoccus massiliensis TaxID=1522310 RepID=UPI0006940937|nr:biotin-dependent carboxyltransferase family protein [Mobilicoccus massiliensis]